MSQQSAPQPQPGKKKDQDRWAHPATLAVITGVLTLTGTLAAALIAARGGHLPGPQAAEVTVTATTTVQSTVTTTVLPGGPTAGPTGASTTLPPGQVTWQKKVVLPKFLRLDIDEAGPRVVTSNIDTEFWIQVSNRDPVVRTNRGKFGVAGVAAPSAQECREALGTNALADRSAFTVGSTMCVLSAEEVNPHLASVRFVKLNKSVPSFELDVTVWRAEAE